MTEAEWIQKLQTAGYSNIGTPSFGPNQEIPEHTHYEATVHAMLSGELTLVDVGSAEKILRAGDYFEIPAGTTHRAKAGSEGCRFVVGTKMHSGEEKAV